MAAPFNKEYIWRRDLPEQRLLIRSQADERNWKTIVVIDLQKRYMSIRQAGAVDDVPLLILLWLHFGTCRA